MTVETFTITHTFSAPRSLVWKAWTQPDRLAAWFGPKDCVCKILKHDLHVGGIVHSRLDIPGGAIFWGKFTYQEIVPETKLVWLHSFTDEGGVNKTRHPFNPHWPLELLTTVVLEDQSDKTKLTLTWTPVGANEDEQKAFTKEMPGATKGWSGTFDQLEIYLKSPKTA